MIVGDDLRGVDGPEEDERRDGEHDVRADDAGADASPSQARGGGSEDQAQAVRDGAVSYTHLTLPTKA